MMVDSDGMWQRRTQDRALPAAMQSRCGEDFAAADPALTPVRQHVLSLLRKAHGPMGAYALRDLLEQALARKVAPPTVYRALDYLQRCGLAARVESHRGWIARELPDGERAVLYCVCRACGTVLQMPVDARAQLQSMAARRGFVAGDCTLEVNGLCGRCRVTGV